MGTLLGRKIVVLVVMLMVLVVVIGVIVLVVVGGVVVTADHCLSHTEISWTLRDAFKIEKKEKEKCGISSTIGLEK